MKFGITELLFMFTSPRFLLLIIIVILIIILINSFRKRK